MIDINKAAESSKEDIDAVLDWCKQVYQNNFGEYFSESCSLFDRMKSKEYPITDDELGWILITLPINLFQVSEILSRMRLNHEVVKLRYKQREFEIIKESSAKTVTQKRDEAAIQMIDDKLLMLAYESLISRVESEISLSRELIMGAKKIWDSRRKTDNIMPVGEIDDFNNELPNYHGKKYIHGGIE